MSRFQGIFICALLNCAAVAVTHADLPRGYDRLVVARTADEQVVQAARDMAMLLQRSYGSEPSLHRQRLIEVGKSIVIGTRPDHPLFDENPLSDEILILRTRRGIEIHGSDNTATCFAVYRFLQHFLGWRYYHPGELGLERLDNPPQPPSVSGGPEVLLHETAGYFSRNLSGIRSPSGAIDWFKWNGLREKFSYSHAVHRIITPDLFGEHPDWFAKDSHGEPQAPPFDRPHGYNDHPDLRHPEVRAEVVRQFKQQMEDRLATPATFSLSLGDSFVFGHFPDDYPWKPQRYFRRWPDWSNHVFAFTNAVAAQIADYWNDLGWDHGEKPELHLGALSYLTWENTPDFNVHPWIVPCLTYDRSQWYDPVARADDLATVARWAEKRTRVLGTWDYLFGYGFLMPRSLTSVVSDSIPSLHRLGMRAYYSQVSPVWPYDAHTTWLATRLLWNPEADAGNLLDEFYREYYGPSWRPMRAFHELAGHNWMSQGSNRGWWLRYWKDPWQAALWDQASLKEMNTLLADAMAAASGSGLERFHQRIRMVAELFEVTCLLVEYQSSAWKLQSGRLDDVGRVLAFRHGLEKAVAQAAGKNPLSSSAADLSWVFRYDSIGGSLPELVNSGTTGITGIAEWCRIQGYSGIPDPARSHPVLFDTNFDYADNPRIWNQSLMDSEGAVMTKLPGGGGFLAAEVRRGHLYQPFQAEAGNFYLGSLDVDTSQSPSGEVYIRVDFFDTENNLISESRRARIAPTDRHGTKQRLKVLAQAPENAQTGRLFIRFYEMDRGSQAIVTNPDVRDLGHLPYP